MKRFRKVGVLAPVVDWLERNLARNKRIAVKMGRIVVVAEREIGRGR